MTTRVERWFEAPPEAVYGALTDQVTGAAWRVPDGMSVEVHEFDPRVGGRLRVSLTYQGDGAGKTRGRTDTYRGRFVELVPGRRVVEEDEFETDDPALGGVMRITIELAAENQGTRLVAVHEGLPAAVSEEDNLEGWRQALERLAGMVERRDGVRLQLDPG
jgi:uncharacterized protein YndB with AHSA1/START domain